MAIAGWWGEACSHAQSHHRGLSLEKPGEGALKLAGREGEEAGDGEDWARLTSGFSGEKSGAPDQPLTATQGVGA